MHSRPPRGGRGLKYTTDDIAQNVSGRPPRGGRGLKSVVFGVLLMMAIVAPLAGGVD